MSKGDQDTRTPDHAKRRKGYDRIKWGEKKKPDADSFYPFLDEVIKTDPLNNKRYGNPGVAK